MIDRIITLGATSVIFRVKLRSSLTGQGLTGLAYNTSGLIISTLCDNEASATTYTAAGSTIETITTLGTYAAPTATKCRFKEVDATNHPGTYEVHLADARYAVANSQVLRISFLGAANLMEREFFVQLIAVNMQDAVRLGLTALPNAAAEAAGGLFTRGSGAGQINQETNGRIDANLKAILGTALTESVAGYIAAAVKKFFDVASPVFTAASVNQGADNNVILANATYGLAALKALIDLLGTSANQTSILNAVNAITTSTARSAPRVPVFMPRPASSSLTYLVEIYLYDLKGNLEDADSNTVTIHARNSAGTSCDAGLSATTMTRVSAGHYRVSYTVAYTDTAEAVYFDFTWAVGTVSMADGGVAQVQDAENYAYLAAIYAATGKMQFDSNNNIKSVEQVKTDFGLTDSYPKLTDLAGVEDVQSGLATATNVSDAKDDIITAVNAATPSIDFPTAEEIRQEIDAHSTKMTSILNAVVENAGSGEIAYPYVLTDDATSSPIAGATVQVSTDVARTTIVASGTTDVNGSVTFNLDAGTYYFWRTHPNYTFTDPDIEVVS